MSEPRSSQGAVILALTTKSFTFYTFEKKPIILAFALDKSVVARRTDREFRQDILINNTLVLCYFPAAILSDNGGRARTKVIDSIDG